MVDVVEVGAVLPRVFEARGGDLGELAGAGPARGGEGVGLGGVALPVSGRGSVGTPERLAVEVEALVVAVPRVRLNGEAVGCVGRALVVALDLDSRGVLVQGTRMLGLSRPN